MANDILQGVPYVGSWAVLCSEGNIINSECELNGYQWTINCTDAISISNEKEESTAAFAGMADGTHMMALSCSGGGQHLQGCCQSDSGELAFTLASKTWLWYIVQVNIGGKIHDQLRWRLTKCHEAPTWCYCRCSEMSADHRKRICVEGHL